MNILGIVAEYNPFHNGHKYQIDKACEIVKPDFTFCVMSGNFVQRGEPAIYNKFTRAKSAIKNGIDIVFELPLPFCLSSAEIFAENAVNILINAGVTHLSFGCETDDLNLLNEIVDIIINEPPTYKTKLKECLNNGLSYAKSREIAINELVTNNVLKCPNNILAIEYLKAIKKLKSNIIPVPIKRYKVDYNSLESVDNIASASAIRNMIKLNEDISKFVPENIPAKAIFPEDFNQLLMFKLRSSNKKDFLSIQDINEGLENSFINAINSSITLDQIIEKVKSKRYTMSRIKRILFNLLLDVDKHEILHYIRILACSNKGITYLPKLNDTSSLPIITSVNRFIKTANKEEKELLLKEIYATNVYSIISNEPFNLDIKNKI